MNDDLRDSMKLWRVLIFGSGYVSTHLATRLAQAGAAVWVTTRNPERHAFVTDLGAKPHPYGAPLPVGLSHILSTVPPLGGQDPVLLDYGKQLPPKGCRWVGYLSSTGVYGDAAGQLVDEDSPTQPQSSRGQSRLAAEELWRATVLQAQIFRLAGIYGPQRDALADVLSGNLRDLPPVGGPPINRIHVADIVNILLHSMANPTPLEVYNLADDDPAPRRDVLLQAARLLGREAELFRLPIGLLAPDGVMGEGSRVVDNSKVLAAFSYALEYPSYREGLVADAALLKKQHS